MATQLHSNCTQTRPHHSTQDGNKVEAKSQHPSAHHTLVFVEKPRCDPTLKKNEEVDNTAPRGSPPCRILRRDVAATKHTTRRTEQHQIQATHRLPCSRRHYNTTRGGLAASAVGLHLSRLRTGVSPHPPHNSTPRIRFRIHRQSGEERCPAPPVSTTATPTPLFRLCLVALPSHLATTAIAASQGSRLRRLPTLYHTRRPQPG